jgi:hypothetical protein
MFSTLRKSLFILLCYLFCLPLFSENRTDSVVIVYTEQRQKNFALPDSNKEKAIFNKEEYQYKAIKKKKQGESFWERFWRFIGNLLKGLDRPDKSASPVNIFKWILLILGIALAIFLLYKSPFIKILKGNKRIKNIDFDSEEIKLSEETIDQMIDKAERNSDFRKAIRLQLLKYLKYLSDSNQIFWESHKTNQDFIYEIKNNAVRTTYIKIARQYDLVWYGERKIEKEAYETIKNMVLSPSNKING